jgi:hypothetical protein
MSRQPAGSRSDSAGYIQGVTNDDLVAANRGERIDHRSKDILDREKRYVEAWRKAAGAGRQTDDVTKDLAALALSGGGIRSAVFALGVTQALAAKDRMRRFDYLSTVSGGGYLGCSLTWLTRDRGGAPGPGMAADTFPYGVDPPRQQTRRRAQPADDERLIYLRHHGKYLTPGGGIDVVSGIAVVLRGFLINLLVWIPIVALALLFLFIIPLPYGGTAWDPRGDFPQNGYGLILLLCAAAALFFAAVSVGYSLWTFASTGTSAQRYDWRRAFEKRWLRYPLLFAAIGLPLGLVPYVHGLAEGWIAATGAPAIVLGLASAAWTFLRSRGANQGAPASATVLAPVAAPLLLYGILTLSYDWVQGLFQFAAPGACFTARWPLWLDGACISSWHALEASAGAVVLALLLGIFVNVNLVSVHRFYRDRLMEAFLPDDPPDGERKATGLALKADVQKVHELGARDRKPTGPYPLINTNVILVGSQDRTWRLRGGDSFILSPLVCGSNATGWCPTEKFIGGDLSLATAMAISGAAANPHAGGGLFRNRFVAMLMSLANLRLGYWVTNPGHTRRRPKWRNHFTTTWRELSSRLDETRLLVQLSDGGHFENLAIYELIRRRVRLIVACDGTADPQFCFSDFVALLSRVSTDFGARIHFGQGEGLGTFMPCVSAGYPRDTLIANRGYATAKIVYSDGSEGDLIYLTTTLFKGLGLEVMGYRAAFPDFPDQTTADQFFDEAQFEAYRALGYGVAEHMLDDPDCQAILARRLQ